MSDMVFVWAIGATVTWGFVTAKAHELSGYKEAGYWKQVALLLLCICGWPLILGTELGAAIGKLNNALHVQTGREAGGL